MKTYIHAARLSGAVSLLACGGNIAAFDAIGMADLSKHRPMRTDTLFWIASMTKPITAAAVMILAEKGELSITAPVERYLPEFGNLCLLEETRDKHIQLRRPCRPVTIFDLLTHTSGIAATPQPSPEISLAEWVRTIARDPLQFEPGTQWRYGDAGMSVLGRIVEIVSGEAFADFLQSRFFAPLGMRDTTFFPTAAQMERLAISYVPREEGMALEETVPSTVPGSIGSSRRTVLPGAGLFSTAEDVFRFYQMILNGGQFQGRRYLREQTVREMTRPQTGNLETGFSPGMSFGLAFGVVKRPMGITSMLSRGTFGHDGVFGTSCWADPSKRLLMINMMQRAKLNIGNEGMVIRTVFHSAAAALLC